MSTEKYAITSVGNILPLNTKDEIKIALDKFNNLKEEFKQESASIIFNECNAHNIPIPDNSELYRFINLSEEIIDKVKVFDCEYFYISSNDLDDGHSSINSLEPMSTSINKAIKRSDIFKSNISVNPNSSMGKTFLANLFTIKKENNDFEFIKIALIEVTYYNKFTYSYEIKKIYTFDNNEVYKDSKKNDNDGILDEDINDVLNNDSDAVDFFYLGEASDFKRGDLKDDDFGIPELRKFPMHDKKHVLLAIKFFNTYVGTKYEKELADNINRKIKEFKIDDSEIHMTNANQFKKYYKPYSKDGKILREEFHISGDIYGWYASEKKLPEPLCKGSVDEDLTYPDFNDAIRACNTTKQALKMYDDGELVGKKFKCHMYAFDRDMNPEYKGEYEYSISNKEFKGHCPWIDGNYIKNESLSIIYEHNNDDTIMNMYHLSQSNLNNLTVKPTIPDNYFTKNGYEENKTPRVCFAINIDRCLRGLSLKCEGMELYVHVPYNNRSIKNHIKKPTTKEVPDSRITQERWITVPVKMKCIGKIKVLGDKGEPGLKYTYGNGKHTAYLYDWNWKWIEKYNDIILNDSYKVDELSDYPWIDGNYIKNESLSIIYGKAYTYKPLKTIHDLDEFKENMITVFKDHNTMSDDMIIKTMRKIVLPNTEVIGYVGFSNYNIDGKKYLGIGNFMIFENYQRKGHGTRVIRDIISIYSNEYDEIYCYVDKNNKTAIAFYKKIADVNTNNLTNYGYYVTLYKKDTLTESFNDKWHNIKNIIFDLGNVLVSCDLVSELMNKLNFTEEQAHKVENIVYPKEGIYEHLSLDEFKDALIERFRNLNMSISEEELNVLMDCVKSSIKVKPYTISMIHNMTDVGDKVYYLSNWAKWLRELTDDNLDFIYSMNGGVFSYEIGSVKPEKSIYTTLLDKYNLNPTECVFFDDKIANIDSAENNGIYGVVVTPDFDEDKFYSSIREAEARINNSIIKEEYSNLNANILTDLVVGYYFSEDKLEDDKLSTKYIDENQLYRDFNTALLNSDYIKSIIKNLTTDEIRRTEFEAFVYSIDSANNLYYTGSIKFRLSNDGDDYYLDYWQWYEKNENNVLNESIFFSRKDSYINFEKFESGESNILLITGLSGSGKSTLAKEMAEKYDAINLELDLFEQCYIFSSFDDIKKYEPPMYEYFSRHNNLYEKLKNKELHNQALWKEIKNYCKWLVSYCSKDTKNRYVIEGVQIYSHLSSSDVNGLPLIFKNTSMSKSLYRRIKRSKNNGEDMSFKNQEYFKMLSWYFGEENAYKEFKKMVNKSSKNEDMDVLNEDIESIYSSIYARVSIDKEKNAFILKGFNFKKFLTRLRSYYDYRGITNLFDKNYSWWSEMMWKKEKIKKADMKIINLEVPLFFALEMYKIFEELGDFYGLSYYKKISRLIYKKTWISNADKITTSNLTPLTNASRLRYNLLDHQKRFIENYSYLKYKYELDGYVLAFKPGYGKTLTAIALAECLDKDQIIIVCENTLKENWSYEIKDYFEKYDDEKTFKDEVFVTNHPKYVYTNKTKYIIVNMDNVKSCYKYIKKNSNTMIIVDECHNFKNYFNKRCQELFALKEMTKCKDNLMMSGTPLKVSAIESVPSLKMIDSHMTDDIAKRYIKSFNSKNTQLSKVVYERYNRVMYRDKNVDLGLPDKNIHTVSLKIRNSEDYLIRVINAQVGELFIKYYNEQIQKLSQYQSEFESLVYRYSDMSRNETKKYLKFIYTYTYNRMDVANKYHEYRIEIYTKFLNDHVYNNSNMSKVDRDRLEFLVKNYVHAYNVAMGKANGEILPKARANCYNDIFNQNVKYFTNLIDKCPKKTIIFTPYKSIVSNVVDTLKKNDIGVVYITGDVKGKDRMSELEKFKNDDSIDVLVATTKTLSTGVTLIEATQMFFLGTPYRQTDFNQACDRIYRIGQTMNVDIYKVLLDTNNEPNLTTRIEQILNWSDEMANSLLNEDMDLLSDGYSKAFTKVINDTKVYHLSKKKLTNTLLKPRVQSNKLTNMGYEDGKIPRICVAPTIDGCFAAMDYFDEGEIAYVYTPIDSNKIQKYLMKPDTKEVIDADETGELWLMKPTKFKLIGTIIYLGDSKDPKHHTRPIAYKHGKSENDYDLKWMLFAKWEWKDIIDEEEVNLYKTLHPKKWYESLNIINEAINNRAKIIEIAKKKFEENGFKANFGKNQDRFINGSGKNGLCDENTFCVSGLGNQYSKITKCCSQINKEIKPLGGKISPDNYGTAFIKCKPLTEDIDIIDEVAGVAVAPSVEGKSPYVVDTYDYIEQKKLSDINPVEKLNDVLDKFDRDKNGVAKLDESIITYKDLASNNLILDESVIMSQNTLWGLKRVRINAQNMERYSEELKRIGYYKIGKVYNPKVDAGEFLLDNNDNIKACILIDCSYEIKNVPINCLYFIYIDKEACNEHTRVEWLEKLINIAQNKYSVEVIEADSSDKELIQLLIEDKFGYSVLDNNGKILTLTCYDGLLEDFNLVFNESEIPDNSEITNYDTHVYIPLINKANQPTVLEQLGTTNGVRSEYGLWNPIIYFDGKKFRERAECIIFNDNNEIYMSVNLNRCRIPGGGSMPNKLIEDQLIDECREEARINIKDLEYVGVYRNMYTEAHQEIYDKRDDIENVHYDGALTYLFIAKYDSKYTGDISAYDKDDIIMTGRFIPMTDVIAKYNIKDEWKVAIIKYMAKFNNSYAELYKKFNMDTRFLYINDNDNSNIRLVSEDWIILNEASNNGKRTKAKRAEMEKIIYTFFSLIDKTGKNAEKYKNKFSKMTDKQFFDYMDDFLNDDKKNFYLEILPNLNEPSLKQIKEVADYLGINLDEYIFYRSYGDDKQPVRSPYKVPVGYISIRRLQQTLSKKNTYSFDISNRNKNGVLTGHDRIARITDMETYELTARGSTEALKEFMSARSDNPVKKRNMYRQIANYGYVYLKDIDDPNHPSKGQALSLIADYIKAAGLKSDL